MPLDPELEKAVREVTKKLGQPEQVSKRLLAWLKDASEKALSKDDDADHLKDVFSALKGSDE